MKTRFAFLAGAGVGYLLGARAGRKSYENIKNQATSLWKSPAVQDGVQRATETISQKAPVVAEKAKEVASAGAEKAKEAVATGADKAKEKAEEVKANQQEAKAEKKTEKAQAQAEKEAEKADKKADRMKQAVPGDVISDPATALEDEGPALS